MNAKFNIFTQLRTLIAAHELLFAVAGRDIRAKYKQAFIGFAWAVLQPLALMVMFTLVFSRFAKIPSDNIPYPIFSYTALLPWGFFSGGIASAAGSIIGNTSLITKIRMPREVFPLGAILARGFDLGISLVIFIAMMLLYKVTITIHILWVLPLLIIQVLLMLAIGLLLSSLEVFYRDINFGIGLFMQVWMFASPVAYPISIVPERYLGIYMLNPMVAIMDGYRKAVLQGSVPDLVNLFWVFTATTVGLFFCYWFFKSQEGKFADFI